MTLEVPPASSPAVHNVMIANKSTRVKTQLVFSERNNSNLSTDFPHFSRSSEFMTNRSSPAKSPTTQGVFPSVNRARSKSCSLM